MITQENWGDCPIEPLKLDEMVGESDQRLTGIAKQFERGERAFWRRRGFSEPPTELTMAQITHMESKSAMAQKKKEFRDRLKEKKGKK
jgi:hypothetical protein